MRYRFYLRYLLLVVGACPLVGNMVEQPNQILEPLRLNPRVAVKFYEMVADNLEDAHQKMLRVGPKDPTGRSRYAEVDWNIAWSWPKNIDGSFDYRAPVVIPTITMTLPRISFSTTHDQVKNMQTWQHVYTALVAHESNHAHHALHTAADIELALQKKSASGETSAQVLNSTAYQMIADNNLWDISYDERTRHGVTEGVALLGE